jgi:2,3-dihydro-2,3-dihydroxybenzoate dehydrogenase
MSAQPVTLVTGAARGIGAAVAELLAGRGHRLALFDRDPDQLRETAEKIAADLPDQAVHIARYPVDVTSAAEVDEAVARVEREQGPIGSLVNVAGVLHMANPLEIEDADWDHMFAVNATGVMHVSRAVGRRMAGRRAGAIVTVASNAAGTPRSAMAGYAASKAASASYTRSLGVELAPKGIRCNVVAPGSTETDMLHSMWHNPSDRQSTIDGSPEQYRLGIPLGKLAQPSDIARSVAFLLSEDAGHIALATLLVDGGATLGAA